MTRQGYEVTILDPSRTILREAEQNLASEGNDARRQARLVEGKGEEASCCALDGELLDAALCHGILMYLDDPHPMMRALAAVIRPDGVVSVLAKNASVLTLRPALEGRYKDTLAMLGADRDLGRLGVVTCGDTVEDLAALFEKKGIEVVRWYGVRVFTDPCRTSWSWSGRLVGGAYRSVARLTYVVGRKKPG